MDEKRKMSEKSFTMQLEKKETGWKKPIELVDRGVPKWKNLN